MAGATIFAIDDLQHVDFVAACLELETEIAMTDLAAKTDSVEPVGEHDRPHAGVIGELIDYDVTVFCFCGLVIQEGKGHSHERYCHQ